MMTTDVKAADQALIAAADLIATRGWDRSADPFAPNANGALSVRGALEAASPDAAYDAVCDLASYVIDAVFIPMHSALVYACRHCRQCPEHTNRPLVLDRDQTCARGCRLCRDHMHMSDPHGHDAPLSEDIVDAWEGYMPHARDVISGLRAAASRPAL